MEWIKKLFRKKEIKPIKKESIFSVDCIGCGENYGVNDFIKFRIIGEDEEEFMCYKCVTGLCAKGKFLEILNQDV